MNHTPTPEFRRLSLRYLLIALPPICDIRRGMLVWALAMMASSTVGLWLSFRGVSGKEAGVNVVFFLGGLIAWPFALYLARLLALGRAYLVRLAAALFSLTSVTIAVTGIVFSQQYRAFYAQWHEAFATRIWAHQFLETSASGGFQFLLFGLKFYFPLGILFLFVASLWLAKRMR